MSAPVKAEAAAQPQAAPQAAPMSEPAPRLAVARPGTGLPTPLILAVFALLAVALFLVLNGRRGEAQARSLTTPTPDAAASDAAPPLELPAPQPPPSSTASPTPAPRLPPAPLPLPPAAPAAVAASTDDPRDRLRAPAVVVDLGGRPLVLAQANQAPSGGGKTDSSPSGAMITALEGRPDGGVEAMAQSLRLGGASGAAVATPMADLRLTIPQGAVIPAVLETAINSDLPGFTRAVVSRDVFSFDGGQVLIPRGSRLIGQYRSAVSLGQSRAFVIWSRVIRPDGVSVQIASPGTDQLGRGGLTGEVDRHFFTRFGGSILLSVLNAATASVAREPTTTISIGSPGQAGAAAAAVQPQSVPPTIKVAQGEAIRIFVARDLDFSAVGPAR